MRALPKEGTHAEGHISRIGIYGSYTALSRISQTYVFIPGIWEIATRHLRESREGQQVLVSFSPVCYGLVCNMSQTAKQRNHMRSKHAVLWVLVGILSG